jgi:hypothetical protein
MDRSIYRSLYFTPITSSGTVVANQAECEALCSNNVNCALYESWGAGNTLCWQFAFAWGVASVSTLQLNMLLGPWAGCITALKTH